MTTRTRRWAVRLAAPAEADFQDVLRWTAEHFGDKQARVYAKTLSMAFDELATAGPTVLGAKARNDLAKGLFTLHVARHGRKGRHFVMFRIGHDQEREVIEILRLLHDAMDLPRHVPPTDDSR